MNIIDYLEDADKENYDFTAEYATDEYRNAPGIEKYIIYKAYTLDNSWSGEFQAGRNFREEIRKIYCKPGKNWIQDPDENPKSLLWEIYKRIWPELQCSCSDTMTSVQYIMSGYFEKKIETKEEKGKRLEISGKQLCTIRYMINLFASEDMEKGHLSLKEKIGKAVTRLDKEHEHLEDFLAAWHKLGNYCPVPKGFNSSRSNMGKHDFWDLTLMMIRKWYLADDELLKQRILREDLFHNCQKADIGACTGWLNQCGGEEGSGEERWEKFVKTLCFEDWVNCEAGSSYYEVLPLWEGHGWDNALLPADWEAFFLEYGRRITARTKRLMKRMTVSDEK